MRAIFLLFLSFNLLFCFDFDELSKLVKKEAVGDFNQTKIIKNFQNPLYAFGEFSFKNGEFLQTTKKPISTRIMVNKNGIFEFDGERFVKSEALFDEKLFLALLNVDILGLKSEFDAEISGDKNSWKVSLKPKGIIAKIFEKITICGDNFVRSLTLNETSGDETIYWFFNLR